MTSDHAKARQAEIVARGMNLGWWYGTRCEKCCEVYPKLMHEGNPASQLCYYQCEVCGKRTAGQTMPWMAEKEWNEHHFLPNQISMQFED